MVAERFYIFRCGKTEACALAASKEEVRLPIDAREEWAFWMQITRHQVEDGRYGFAFDEAVARIRVDGFFLFRGSPKLLGTMTKSQAPANEPPTDA